MGRELRPGLMVRHTWAASKMTLKVAKGRKINLMIVDTLVSIYSVKSQGMESRTGKTAPSIEECT